MEVGDNQGPKDHHHDLKALDRVAPAILRRSRQHNEQNQEGRRSLRERQSHLALQMAVDRNRHGAAGGM